MFLLKLIVAALLAAMLFALVATSPCLSELKCVNGGSLDQSVCKCDCQTGYHGRYCEAKSADVCTSPDACRPNWACFQSNQLNGFSCTCKTGRCGWNCDKADPEMARACNPNPCQNGGYCSSAIDWDKGGKSCKVACKCKNGFGGLRCEIRDPCRTNRCQYPKLAECAETATGRLGRICSVINEFGSVEVMNDDLE